MKVKEIMTKDVTSIAAETNAKEALDLLQKREISGLPVMDANRKLVGMFTEKEVLSTILPSYIEKVGRFVYMENPKAVRQKARALSTIKVKDIMRQDVITVDEDTALCEVARLMLTQKARRIPVLNKIREVVGIVSRGDILRALFEEYSSDTP
ncbi:CBS domain-containing protein [bacterium]|nr:MAG: CBS domain-containing protein [bacterium]